MTAEQVEEYLNGASPEEIVIKNGETLSAFLRRKGVESFEIPWYSIDGGGEMVSFGGDFSLSGTVGQVDAGSGMAGGQFTLSGGFWAVQAQIGSAKIFCDGFESGDTSNWSSTAP